MILASPEVLSDVIGSIYDSVHDSSSWLAVVAKCRNLFHGSKACVGKFGTVIQPSDAISTEFDPEFVRLFIEEHAHEPNILAEAVGNAPLGVVYNDHSLAGDDRLRRSRFWNDWMAPQNMYDGIGVKLISTDDAFWFFDIQRGRNQPAFEANDRAMLNLLVPHLRRAVEITHTFLPQPQTLSVLSHLALGAIFVDATMRVLEMNESAECVIASGATSLRMSNGQLSAASAETDAELRRLVADACSSNADVVPGLGGNLLLPGRADDAAGFGHALTVVPHVRRDELRFLQGRHAVVFIKNLTLALPPDFDRDLRAVFNLSPAEARLAVALASGLSLKDAASQQNIRFSTARSYLEVIFRKTDTRQQSQLVALLKSAQPLTGLD